MAPHQGPRRKACQGGACHVEKENTVQMSAEGQAEIIQQDSGRHDDPCLIEKQG
jgi:hypothetical protein